MAQTSDEVVEYSEVAEDLKNDLISIEDGEYICNLTNPRGLLALVEEVPKAEYIEDLSEFGDNSDSVKFIQEHTIYDMPEDIAREVIPFLIERMDNYDDVDDLIYEINNMQWMNEEGAINSFYNEFEDHPEWGNDYEAIEKLATYLEEDDFDDFKIICDDHYILFGGI